MTARLHILCLLFLSVVTALPALAQDDALIKPSASVVRVSVTSQGYDFYRPWQRSGRTTKIGLGTMIDPGHFIVTATLAEDAVLVELERMDSGEQAAARVVAVDYVANLALIVCDDSDFVKGMEPLELAAPAQTGTTVTAWQFEENGTPFLTDGVIRAIETATYPFAGRGHLVYRAEISLSQLTSAYVIPLITDGKLAGVLMQYDSNSRIMTLVPAPIIQHFLTDWRDGDYQGFPSLGVAFAFLDDPQFRRYLNMEGRSGVYISDVAPMGAAAEAGVKKGDVLIAIDDYTVDRNGEYHDPDFGRISVAHLVGARSFAGDTRELRVIRDGQTEIIPVELTVAHPYDEPVPPFLKDQAPVFTIQSGVVFSELTGQYLAAWGANWRTRAPRRLVYYRDHQYDFLQPGQRLVFVSYVLPFDGNVGYDNVSHQVVTEINGRRIYGIGDVAEAFEHPINGFHEVILEVNDRKLILKADDLAEENARIQQLYRLPLLQRLKSTE